MVLTDEQKALLKEIREMEVQLREHELNVEELQSEERAYDAHDEKCMADFCASSLIELVMTARNTVMVNHPTVKRLSNEFHEHISLGLLEMAVTKTKK